MFAMGPAFFQNGYALLVLSGSYSAGTVGTAYSQSLTIAGGNGVYSLTGGTGLASGSLPAGLALSIVGSTLVLSGTPTATATSAFTVSVSSGDGQTATSAQSVVIVAGSTAYRDAVLADSPLHYYRFGESSGTALANIGTSGTAGTYGSDASNWTGAGLVAGDSTRGLSIPAGTVSTAIVNGGSTTNTDFSVEVIVKPLGVNSGSTGGVIWSYGPPATNSPGMDYIDAGSGTFRLRYMRVGTAVIFTSASAYAYGTKLHVVIRHTRSTHLCEMWINGVKEASTGTFTATTTSFSMSIANQNFPPWITFYGQLDELAYYNTLLSPTRIAAHAALA